MRFFGESAIESRVKDLHYVGMLAIREYTNLLVKTLEHFLSCSEIFISKFHDLDGDLSA